jgi:hypothetical protein
MRIELSTRSLLLFNALLWGSVAARQPRRISQALQQQPPSIGLFAHFESFADIATNTLGTSWQVQTRLHELI